MTRITIAAASLVSLLALAPHAHASECKGLEQSACTANTICTWQPARVAGEASPKTGKPYARSAKAHCQKGRTQKPAATNQ